jgi:hypothetical protein
MTKIATDTMSTTKALNLKADIDKLNDDVWQQKGNVIVGAFITAVSLVVIFMFMIDLLISHFSLSQTQPGLSIWMLIWSVTSVLVFVILVPLLVWSFMRYASTMSQLNRKLLIQELKYFQDDIE